MGLITQTHYQYYNNSQQFTATANQTVFQLTFDPLPTAEADFIIRINGSEVDDNLYTYSSPNVTFASGRTAGDEIDVVLIKRKHGNYRYVSLKDIINNYMMAYVGDGKLIPTCKRTDVLFHAKRGIQEFSYDISRVEKIQEIQVGTSLSIPMPQDYVHYVRLSCVDSSGVEKILFPARYTSKPSQSILQDDDYNYLYDDDNTLLTGTPVVDSNFRKLEHGNITGAYQDDQINYSGSYSAERIAEFGKRYGLDPELATKNGVFVVDEANGKIGFSSELVDKVITLKYISDGLGTDDEMKIHKLAEDAMYKYITYGIASARSNYPEFIINRFRKERRAAMRNAKIRLSNLKLGELTQVMRGKSKIIK
tara:strand:- start:70 stop:1164 length:1095 start_codon:yes stop_codon:yes gene_type:complete